MTIIITIIIILIIIALLNHLFECLMDFLKENKWVMYLAIFVITAFVFPALCIIELIIFTTIWIYKKIKSNANDLFQKRAKELADELKILSESFYVEMCWNDKKLRRYYNVINIKNSEDKETFIMLLKPIIEEIAQKSISDFLIKIARSYGAFTYNEIFDYAESDLDVVNLYDYKYLILTEIRKLVRNGKLSEHPMGENKILYENNSPTGRKMKSTVIEM